METTAGSVRHRFQELSEQCWGPPKATIGTSDSSTGELRTFCFVLAFRGGRRWGGVAVSVPVFPNYPEHSAQRNDYIAGDVAWQRLGSCHWPIVQLCIVF